MMGNLNLWIKCLYNKSLTPFEKSSENLNRLEEQTANDYLEAWQQSVSREGDPLAFDRYKEYVGLNDNLLALMLAENCQSLAATPWTDFLYQTIAGMEAANITFDKPSSIPFYSFFTPFISLFAKKLEASTNKLRQDMIDLDVMVQLQFLLSKKLSKISESVLLKEFEQFQLNDQAEALNEDSDARYQAFVLSHIADRYCSIFDSYPMLARRLATTCAQFLQFSLDLLTAIQEDRAELSYKFNQKLDKVTALQMDAGDQHNGASTVIITFDSRFKIVYKPGCSKVTLAYNQFVNWVNGKLAEQLVTFEVVNKGQYAWLEFIEHKECQSEEELPTYFKRAGILTGLAYFLNSRDLHYENVIAHGDCPVLIDHETLVGPIILDANSKLYQQTEGSILQTNLLPTNIKAFPSFRSGFGSSVYHSPFGFVHTIASCNTDKMRKTVQLKNVELQKKNKPCLNGEFQNLADYKSFFQTGLESLYKLILDNKSFLLGLGSPLQLFENIEIRFVWRPTHVYSNLLAKLNHPKYLGDANLYGIGLELLARAYLGSPALMPILKAERSQLINGDIPVFKLSSSSNQLNLAEDTMINAFKNSAIEAIHEKIRSSSLKDCENQTELVDQSVQY